MIKKYICMLSIGVCLFLLGCSDDVTTVEEESGLPILFTASIPTSVNTESSDGAQTKTETTTTFPNKGSITILAANATQSGINSDGWTNPYMNANATAKGTGPTYPIDVNKTFYWPFNPEKKLVFVAYSPEDYPHSSTTSLSIDLSQKKDVVYTTPTAPMDKTVGTANLGEFKHALAKVKIVVKAIDKDNKPTTAKHFEVTGIKVKTKATTATFDLTKSELTSILAADFTSYSLLTTSTALVTKEGVVAELNILPGNEEGTYIGLTLTDGILDYGKDGDDSSKNDYGYKLAEFTPKGTDKLAFEAGKITTLTFNIQTTNIQDNTIILKGDLKDWECQGNFEVGIE